MNEQGEKSTAVLDGYELSWGDWLFVWGVLGGCSVLSAVLLVGLGYWLGRCG